MSIFSIFKKKKITATEDIIQSNELLDNDLDPADIALPKMKLSYHPEWIVPKEQQYVFQFLFNELNQLKPNQLSLSGIDINVENGNWLVQAFLSSSIQKAVTLETVELLLLDSSKNQLASKEFDLSELGEIPANSARPWVFVFEDPILQTETLPENGWQLAFNAQAFEPHKLDLPESWKDSLLPEQIEALEKTVATLPKLKNTEVNITGFQLKDTDDDGIAASVFIRNGYKKQLDFQQMPLELVDSNNNLVASGLFKLQDFSVKANASKPWTFIFPQLLMDREQTDFSSWTVKITQG